MQFFLKNNRNGDLLHTIGLFPFCLLDQHPPRLMNAYKASYCSVIFIKAAHCRPTGKLSFNLLQINHVIGGAFDYKEENSIPCLPLMFLFVEQLTAPSSVASLPLSLQLVS